MSRPNIVWLTSDHMVWAHHKRLTGYPILPTYERISAEGLTFNNITDAQPPDGAFLPTMFVSGTVATRR